MIWPSLILSVLGAILLILGIVLGWAVFPPIVEDKIEESVILTEGTEQYDRWEELPFPLNFKVYFFNVSNPEEVTLGLEKPKLTEVGPYVYNQFRKKISVARKNGTLSYYQKQSYEFNSTASHPLKEDDYITILNAQLNGVVQQAEMNGFTSLLAVNANMNLTFNKPTTLFLTEQVKHLTFEGVPLCKDGNTATCNEIRKTKPKNMRIEEDGSIFFSFFNHKRAFDDGYYTVQTGENNIKQLGKVTEWENESTLSLWPTDNKTTVCNMINGTDSTIYPPFISRNDTIQNYNTDICRSVDVTFQKEVNIKGIPAYRFIATEDMFPAPSVENGTECFCSNITKGITQENGCMKKGAMELFHCLGSHMVVTFPHFMYADEEYQKGVEGLKPNETRHQTVVDIEPNTGTPVNGAKRVQLNMFLRKVDRIKLMENLKTTVLLPVLWIDEGMEIPDDMVELLNESYFDILKILEAVKWTLIGVGIAFLIGGIMYFLYVKKRQNKTV